MHHRAILSTLVLPLSLSISVVLLCKAFSKSTFIIFTIFFYLFLHYLFVNTILLFRNKLYLCRIDYYSVYLRLYYRLYYISLLSSRLIRSHYTECISPLLLCSCPSWTHQVCLSSRLLFVYLLFAIKFRFPQHTLILGFTNIEPMSGAVCFKGIASFTKGLLQVLISRFIHTDKVVVVACQGKDEQTEL